MKIPIIYNLFPRHLHYIDEWAEELPRIKAMGFNSIFVNPFFETGFSGSLYAVKDYYRLNPLFLRAGQDPSDFGPVASFNKECCNLEISLMIDLVINHTAFDSVLVRLHPEWYKYDVAGKLLSPYAIDPGDGSKVTVWGDLATIDNEDSQDREGLWRYWDTLIAFYQEIGIRSFRGDAAYQVPVALWKNLIGNAKKRDPETVFMAETLGCRLDQIEALAHAGFDYLFNSVKWWNFNAPWAIEQHAENKMIAPSIAFPESHDTERLAAGIPGTIAVQKSRYAFASLFSKGILMPMGYEFGATTKMDVVKGTPNDTDTPQWDISEWIKEINNLKMAMPVLSEEGSWQVLTPYNLDYLFLVKKSDNGNRQVYVCVNKQYQAETVVEEWMIPDEVKNRSMAMSLLNDRPEQEQVPIAFTLEPADVVLFYD